jgi:uncharacterized protein YifN (PemK superfamily)
MDEKEIRAAGWVRPDEPLRPYNQAAIEAAGYVRIGRRQHNLHGTPRVGQVFWVDFPKDAYSPEFVGEHPAVVVRAAQRMSDTCIVVPLTHSQNVNTPHAHKLMKNPNKQDKNDAWAVCSHLYTVALGRLRRFEQKSFVKDVFLSPQDLEDVFAHIRRAMARVFAAPAPFVPPPAQPKPRGPNTLSLRSLPKPD